MKRTFKNRSLGISAKTVVRRLHAAARLPRVKRALSFVLASLAALIPVCLLIGLLAGLSGTGSVALLSVCAALFGAALLSLLAVAFFSFLYADLRTKKGQYALITRYVRGRLLSALSAYRRPLLEKIGGEALLSDLEGYAGAYVLSPADFEALLSSSNLDDTALRVITPYLGLLEHLLGGTEEECRLYLAMRADVRAAVKRWCRYILPRYDRVHYPLLMRNADLALQTVAERRLSFEGEERRALLGELLGEALFYSDPEQGGARTAIPRRSRRRAFAILSDRLAQYPARDLAAGRDGEKFDEYKGLLDEYDAYAARYTLYGCETVDSEACRKRYEQALADTAACYRCGLAYTNGRHRAVCPRCGHVICPDCGACYCERLITHDMARTPFHHR